MDGDWLSGYGIDYAQGLKHSMGDLAFYKMILSMFLQDKCFARGKEACAAGDYRALFSDMHELKGVSGNAALVELHAATVPLVELLRSGDADKGETERMFADVEKAYQRACEGIALLEAQP